MSVFKDSCEAPAAFQAVDISSFEFNRPHTVAFVAEVIPRDLDVVVETFSLPVTTFDNSRCALCGRTFIVKKGHGTKRYSLNSAHVTDPSFYDKGHYHCLECRNAVRRQYTKDKASNPEIAKSVSANKAARRLQTYFQFGGYVDQTHGNKKKSVRIRNTPYDLSKCPDEHLTEEATVDHTYDVTQQRCHQCLTAAETFVLLLFNGLHLCFMWLRTILLASILRGMNLLHVVTSRLFISTAATF